MDLSRPLAVLTPTLDAAVLQTLTGTTAWASGGQVHKMTGTGSADGVRRVLGRLVTQGIVLADEHPHATLYLLNRDHVAAEAIVALARLRTTIIDRLTTVITGWPYPPLHASVFGSFARGQAGPASDIDLLAIFAPSSPEEPWSTQVDQLEVDVMRWTGNRSHIVAITPDVIKSMIADGDLLLKSWRTDHITLAGPRLPDFVRGLA